MATHDVTFEIPEKELGKASISFKVKKDKRVIGTLYISKGTIEWLPKWKSKKSFKVNWTRFDEIMKNS